MRRMSISANRLYRHVSISVHILQEEQEYVELVAAEKHQQEAVKSALAQNKTLSMLDEILEDVRKAADRLEEKIKEHAFDNNKQVALYTQVCVNAPTLSTKRRTVPHTCARCCVDERSKRRGSPES